MPAMPVLHAKYCCADTWLAVQQKGGWMETSLEWCSYQAVNSRFHNWHHTAEKNKLRQVDQHKQTSLMYWGVGLLKLQQSLIKRRNLTVPVIRGVWSLLWRILFLKRKGMSFSSHNLLQWSWTVSMSELVPFFFFFFFKWGGWMTDIYSKRL